MKIISALAERPASTAYLSFMLIQEKAKRLFEALKSETGEGSGSEE